MELIKEADIPTFSSPEVTSRQLLFPENSSSTRVNISRVVLRPGAVNQPHVHDTSEQVWIALRGTGTVLLADERTVAFSEGEVVRFEDGELHGLANTGAGDFEYITVTCPPTNFRALLAKVGLAQTPA